MYEIILQKICRDLSNLPSVKTYQHRFFVHTLPPPTMNSSSHILDKTNRHGLKLFSGEQQLHQKWCNYITYVKLTFCCCNLLIDKTTFPTISTLMRRSYPFTRKLHTFRTLIVDILPFILKECYLVLYLNSIALNTERTQTVNAAYHQRKQNKGIQCNKKVKFTNEISTASEP